jgi:hypothetical protein
MPADDEPTAALTSPTAIVAAILLLVAVIIAAVLVQLSDDDAPTQDDVRDMETEGASAPVATLASLEGRTIVLTDGAGQHLVINLEGVRRSRS